MKNTKFSEWLIVETFNKKTNEALGNVTVIVYDANNNVIKESTVAGNRHEFKIARSADVRAIHRVHGLAPD